LLGGTERVGTDIKGIHAAFEGVEGGRNILRAPDTKSDYVKSYRACDGLSLAQFQHRSVITRIDQNRQSAEPRRNLAQQLDPLSDEIGLLTRQAGNVAAWSRKAGNHPAFDRVIRHRKDDRDN
jgi:hypothetical protein